MNRRNIIISVAVIIALVAGAIFLGRSCDCNCTGTKSGKTSKASKASPDSLDDLKKQVETLQGTLDGYADCLERLCDKKQETSPPRHASRTPPPRRLKPMPLLSLPSDDSSSDSNDCRVVKVVGNVVHTENCQGWQALQYGARKGDDRCPGIYYRGMASNGTFTLSQQRLDENCKNFQLRKGSRWLVITPSSQRTGAGVCVSEPTKGEGLGYRPCNS